MLYLLPDQGRQEDCLYTIAPKESLTFDASVQAYKKGEKELIVDIAFVIRIHEAGKKPE